MKSSFVLYAEYAEHMEDLSMEQRGTLFTAIMNYANEVDLPEMDGAVKMAFSFIKKQLDRDSEKYEDTIEKRRNAGRASGLARRNKSKQKGTERTYVKCVEQTQTKRTDNVDVDVDDDVDVDVNNNSSDSDESDCQNPQADVRRAIELWNTLADLGIKPVSKIAPGAKRFDYLRARIRQYGMAEYENAINRIRGSDFLQGKHTGKPWQITFDWFVLPSNFPKVLEGNYDNTRQMYGSVLENIT